jgi:hypothetical protein
MTTRKSFLLRISPELYDTLAAWAEQEFRSVNGQIEYLLYEAVRQRGRALRREPGGDTADELPTTRPRPDAP